MFKRLFSVFLALPLFGCGPKPEKPLDHADSVESDQTRRVEVRVGGGEGIQKVLLPFRIRAIHENQQRMEALPFHRDGGDWTFLDCEADSQVTFLVGTATKATEGGMPSRWGRAILAVSDNDSGRRFAESIAKAFGGTLPPPSKSPHKPMPLLINTAVLGENLNREADGGFYGEGGGWTATKWFPTNDVADAEVYFNFNLEKRRGEFSEKDADYADDLVSILASALRDGPRPPRTPENDPNLILNGPQIGPSRKLVSRRTSLSTFTPESSHAVYQDSAKTMALSLREAEASPTEIAQFDYSPWKVHLVNNGMDLLVEEGIPDRPGIKSSADPIRIWWVDHVTRKKELLRGPEKGIGLSEAPVSPDLRFVAIEQYLTKANDRTRFQVIHLHDRTNGKAIVVQLPNTDLSLVGWRATDAGIRAVAVTNRWGFEKDEPSRSYLIDPLNGEMQLQKETTSPSETLDLLSPDGKHRVHIGESELEIADIESGQKRQFHFHEEDHPFVGEGCVEWVGPRYLKFKGPRLALIDISTLKMSFPESDDGTQFNSPAYTFSPDFRWVLYQGESTEGEGLYLAPIEMPKD